jgi:amino acid adenylation domain-containing protein
MSEMAHEGIAIIGMAGRFPGAETIEEFWANLIAGRESISFFSDSELVQSGLDPVALNRRGRYIPARGVLKDAGCFDAAFFGIHPKEAEVIDPQQRVFLEACWVALERSGHTPSRIKGAVGVFGGTTFNTYYQHVLQQRPDLIELVGSDLVMFGNEKDYLTTRVAYKLGLSGPALNVSTACSTSLVAVCQACQSLLTYQCDMALAGGASVRVPQESGYFYDEGNIGSADGHTRSFDARGAGTVFSNGVGVVVLKRLEDAIRDGDLVYATIKGAALNNDGSQRVSFGAPGVEGQSEVIAMAHALAGVNPETITYVEAHGTATPLGDPIEVAGLTKAFRLGTETKQYCALGSVKTNIGHLDAAAGVTGLIKTALALHHKVIPASLHFQTPNPKLDLANTPFYVNAELQEWKTGSGLPRRAGVSSFGTGGTNAHVVLEEAADLPRSGRSRDHQLLILSTKTPETLERATSNLTECLRNLGDSPERLADAAFTLQTGRTEFTHRTIVACKSAAEGVSVLEGRDPKRVFTRQLERREPRMIFMFPGQGAQYAGMGAELYRTEPIFRAEVDRCSQFLLPHLGMDLRELVFPRKGFEAKASEQLVQTRFTQPALFVIEYALAKLWMSWGVKPAAMIGHSVGEYVAGCLAGVFTLEDALSLVARRAELVQELPSGGMLAIRLSEQDVLPLLNGHLSLAAINSPTLCVVAGPHDAILKLQGELESRGVTTRRLHTSHAFHSQMMDPVLAPFTEVVGRIKLNAPSIPYVSNVTARWITAEEAKSPAYWAGHVRQTVRFADGIEELVKDQNAVLLEVGPGQTLSTLGRQHPAKTSGQTILASLALTGPEESRGVLETLGRLWMAGVEVDWLGFYAEERRCKIVLPTYPFDRKRYWPEPISDRMRVPEPVSLAPSPNPASLEVVTPKSVPPPEIQAVVSRKERLLAASRTLMQELSGYDLSGVDAGADLLQLGLDSLLLTQAATLFQRKFGVRISFRQLMEELSSLDAIASYIDSNLPPEPLTQTEPVTAVTPAPAAIAVPANTALEQLLIQQQRLTSELLSLLGRPQAVAPSAPLPASAPASMAFPASNKSHGPFKPVDRAAGMALSSEQSRFLEALIARYTARTSGSKKLCAENRPVVADPRSVAGFKQLWKEMVYPIFTKRSDGSKVWDIDGNEYVDFVMGFGASIFGHRPPFVVRAIHEQTDQGFEIGPIHPLSGQVAALIKEFTGMERVGFTNTGSEAVLAASRVARTVTGRDKIAVFAGAYHGIFDEVLFRPLTVNGETRAAPIAPGIPDSALTQVIVLDYGNPQSLEIIRARGSEIAAVLVEPVQSRRLDLQPREFLHELRRITKETGSALIFDEVVTGFRVHPGGAQAHFGVRADLATYGKVIGGGLSIGVVAGDRKFMDALDGGQWQFGDASFPEVGVTFFAGTFVRHPIALAAAKAVLTYLKDQGPELQQRLTQKTEELAVELRAIIEEFQAPYHLTQFSSLIQLSFPPEQKLGGLLFYLLRERGIHIWENRAFVITTAHSDEDLGRLKRAFRESLAELRSGGILSPNSRELLSSETSLKDPPVKPSVQHESAVTAMAQGAFPLTEAQKEIWVAAQMSTAAAVAYNESLRLEFRGSFDVELFQSAVLQVVDRHPILLASISADGLRQEVRSDAKVPVVLNDFSGLSIADRDCQLAALVEREVSSPFDLTAGPLIRVEIARLSPEHHAVIWTAHHIVCDGWSAGLLISELAKIYSALKQGNQARLETPASFRNYALAYQTDTPEAREALSFWKKQFADVPPPLELPADHVRPLVRSAGAATLRRYLNASIQQSLKKVAGQQRTTLVVLLMAALKTFLNRLTGETDIVIGLGAAGQALTGSTCLVGHCLNLLPIRTRLNPESSFQENLASVKKNFLDAYDHHQSTIGNILQHVQVPRSANRPPLVQIIINVDKDPGEAEFEGLELRCERNAKHALHFDLFLNFVDSAAGLCVECDYNTDLFDSSTIRRWLAHFETLLESIIRNPLETVGKLPILTNSEREEVTTEWNKTGVAYAKDKTIHQWFERQTEIAPRARALTLDGQHLTFAELNRRANQVAHYLRGLGVGPDVLVALYVERSMETVIGILGILKAGGAYLPVDPSYPQERLAFMLEDADASVMLTQSSLAVTLKDSNLKKICFDSDFALIESQPDTNPEPVSTPDNLAYVIYTSGSTGTPKGSLVTHYNVVRLLQATEHWFRFNECDVWTFFHSHAFDFSVWELWGALLYGGRVVMVPYMTSRSPEDFYSLLVKEGVTVLNQTPSAFKQLMQVDARQGRSGDLFLRYIIFGGEALEMRSLKPWFDRHGDQKPQLVNMYGITETTVHVTYHPVSAADLTGGSVIGVPIPDLQVYILDPYQQPVPIGVPGEIYVGGAGVARGYLKRQELTLQKFVADPFKKDLTLSLYRSGDLGRYLPNRSIEYLGRIDDQVKIRGFRIELGEIEAVLERHPAVRHCVVIAREDTQGDKLLVAYFEAESGFQPELSDLRAHLKKQLPEYMLPGVFVSMETLPLTINGKIDRKALPVPAGGRLQSMGGFAPPRDAIEQALAQLWEKVLNVKTVGLHDNFFELGGHSLLAVRIVTEIEKMFQKRLPLATLLQATTVGELAEVLREESWKPSWASLVPIKPGGSKRPLFLFHSHGGNVLEYYPLASRLEADQPVYGLQAAGLDGQFVRGRSIEEIATAYLAEITTLQPTGPYFLGGFCFGGLVALEAAQQLTAAGQDVALVVLIQSIVPAATGFKPGTTMFGRFKNRVAKRLDLEYQNFSYRGIGYLGERIRRAYGIAQARISLSLDARKPVNSKASLTDRSMAYILESLGIEHDNAYLKYKPHPYQGEVLLFKAEKQLAGLLADDYLGWKILCNNIEVYQVPGHQQNMLIEPNLFSLTSELARHLKVYQWQSSANGDQESGALSEQVAIDG